jgi:hypothetical protein
MMVVVGGWWLVGVFVGQRKKTKRKQKRGGGHLCQIDLAVLNRVQSLRHWLGGYGENDAKNTRVRVVGWSARSQKQKQKFGSQFNQDHIQPIWEEISLRANYCFLFVVC